MQRRPTGLSFKATRGLRELITDADSSLLQRSSYCGLSRSHTVDLKLFTATQQAIVSTRHLSLDLNRLGALLLLLPLDLKLQHSAILQFGRDILRLERVREMDLLRETTSLDESILRSSVRALDVLDVASDDGDDVSAQFRCRGQSAKAVRAE